MKPPQPPLVEHSITAKLTEAALQKARRDAAAQVTRIEFADEREPGLRIRFSPPSKRAVSGTATWSLCVRDREGRMRRFSLGDWPTLGIADAREAARAMRLKVRNDGADPVVDARRLRKIGTDARAGVGTLKALLDLYGGPIKPGQVPAVKAIGRGKTLKSWPEQRKRMESVFAELLHRPTALLTVADIQSIADSHPSDQSAAAAVRYLRPILKWASSRGRQIVARELTLIEPPATVQRRQRVLTETELSLILPILIGSRESHHRALLFILYTLARREEVAAATWRQIDLDNAVWRLGDTKSDSDHIVPLSQQALRLLTSIGRGAPNELVFSTRNRGHLSNWDRQTKRIMERSGTSGWTRHDLRRTSATMLGSLGIEPHIVEAALNHKHIHSPLAALYNTARYSAQVRLAVEGLGVRLDELASRVSVSCITSTRVPVEADDEQ